MLVNGRWTSDWTPVQAKDADGRFVRQVSGFRDWVGDDGPSGVRHLPATPGRFHLYVALICPWASRTLIARTLKGLEEVVSVSVVEPWLGPEGWAFGTGIEGAEADPHGARPHVHRLYTDTDSSYTGRATVPVLWDTLEQRIVNNESADILKMLDTGFGALASDRYRLRPPTLEAEIDRLNAMLYDGLNNGVYRAGFASSQLAYDEAVAGVFATLDELEARLADGRPWLFGPSLTETDIRLFVTLVRFDVAYHGLFKCNLRALGDYPRLFAHTRRFLALPGVSATVNLEHIRQGYYSIRALNPNGIVPAGPLAPFGSDARGSATRRSGDRRADVAVRYPVTTAPPNSSAR